MTRRQAYLMVAILGILLLGGCTDRMALETTGETISFGAVPALMVNGAETKSMTESFTVNEESFVVFGEKVTSADVHTPVVNGKVVEHHYEKEDEVVTVDYWQYSPVENWDWGSTSDRYDFVAVYPSGIGTTKQASLGNITVSTPYDYSTGRPNGGDKFDILAAGYRRRGNVLEPSAVVDLSFSHMGSAVGVTVLNNSSESKIKVTSLYYQNLAVSADAIVTLDSYGRLSMYWANKTPSNLAVRRLAREPATVINPQDDYTGEFQIMIPQDLTVNDAALYLTYKVIVNGDEGEETTTPPILLKSIPDENGDAITEWKIGYKYTYTVSIRLDGGLLVIVRTVPWDTPVIGETPGILID